MRPIIISLLLAMAVSFTAIAQNITGRVVDENNNSLDYVNVVLMKADSTFVTGTITDENGEFQFHVPSSSPKFVKVSCVGYKELTCVRHYRHYNADT